MGHYFRLGSASPSSGIAPERDTNAQKYLEDNLFRTLVTQGTTSPLCAGRRGEWTDRQH